MISDVKIIEIFCNLDDFMKEFDAILTKHSISDASLPKKRNRKSKMSKSEVMTIMVIFHLKSYRNLKHFYLHYVCKHMDDFLQQLPDILSGEVVTKRYAVQSIEEEEAVLIEAEEPIIH